MILHHYPLQAHLYLLALHRFLLWRLPNYSPSKHLGGYVYIFLRGIPGENAIKSRPHLKNIPGLVLESAPIDRILELDRVFKEGGR